MIEEHLVGHQRGHRDHAPAGQLASCSDSRSKSGMWSGTSFKLPKPVEEFVAGPAGKHPRLALEQGAPDPVLGRAIALPMLGDREVVPDVGVFNAKFVESRHGRGSGVPGL